MMVIEYETEQQQEEVFFPLVNGQPYGAVWAISAKEAQQMVAQGMEMPPEHVEVHQAHKGDA